MGNDRPWCNVGCKHTLFSSDSDLTETHCTSLLQFLNFISEGNIVNWWPLSNGTPLSLQITSNCTLIATHINADDNYFHHSLLYHILHFMAMTLNIFLFFSSETPLFHSAMVGPCNLKCNISFDLLRVCFKIVRSISTSLTLVTVLCYFWFEIDSLVAILILMHNWLCWDT